MRSNAIQSRQRTLQCSSDVRFVQNLASALAVAMNVAPGKQLVMVLGAGDERSNLEAMETWVQLQLAPLRGLTNHQLLTALLQRLEKKLTEYLETGL